MKRNEKLFEEIGLIDDKFIPEMRNDYNDCSEEIKISKVRKPFNWQLVMPVAAAVVLVFGTLFMFYALQPETAENLVDPFDSASSSISTMPTEIKKPTDLEVEFSMDKLVWFVEPTLDLGSIWYCEIHDVFIDSAVVDGIGVPDNVTIDEKTGIPNEEFVDCSHECMSNEMTNSTQKQVWWLYYEEDDSFGYVDFSNNGINVEMYPMIEFEKHFPNETETVKAVHRVNTGMPDLIDRFISNSVHPITGTAVAFGDEFVTDFIYSGQSFGRQVDMFVGVSIIDDYDNVSKGLKHGIIDATGMEVLPFWFNRLHIIDERSAFVRLEDSDKWGIIDIYESYIKIHNVNPGGVEPIISLRDGDHINDDWTVIQDTGNGRYAINDKNGNLFVDVWFDIIMVEEDGIFIGYRGSKDLHYVNYHYIFRLEDDFLFFDHVRVLSEYRPFDFGNEITLHNQRSIDFVDFPFRKLSLVDEYGGLAEAAMEHICSLSWSAYGSVVEILQVDLGEVHGRPVEFEEIVYEPYVTIKVKFNTGEEKEIKVWFEQNENSDRIIGNVAVLDP
jgi:hypothetical protein